jgi:hypothetical protein
LAQKRQMCVSITIPTVHANNSMNPQIVLLLHISGVIFLFLALGAMLAKPSKGAGMASGIALLVVFITGFARMGMMKYGLNLWLIIKIVLWLLLGASIAILKRGLLPKPAAGALVVILGTAAAWSALFKPGMGAAAE